jgi:hypothetical protein
MTGGRRPDDAYKPPATDTTGMSATDLVDAVREDNKTELSRLGSSKSLYADTEGEMEPDAVLSAAADAAHHAAETFEEWAGDDGTFVTAADSERRHREMIVDELDAYEPLERPAVVEAIRGYEATVERLGGVVGWTLVAEEKAGQCSGFFTGQADPGTASLFRGFGDDYEATRSDALEALEIARDSPDDWDRAEAAATGAVGAAYDEYFETLEALGVNPKPVC